MLIQELIRKKRDRQKLSDDEIVEFVRGVNDWSAADGQISAMTMAMLINGIDLDEMVSFINAVVDTGMVLDWGPQGLDGPVVGLAAMPGVGDKVELIVAPLLASFGAYVPMISERMLYYTGGSLDKLEGIKGFSSRPSLSRFRKTLKTAGCAFMSPTDQIIPADSRIQAIRDVSATVNSIPLLAISLLAKKIASGIKTLTVDVKYGMGSFVPTKEAAEDCAAMMKQCAEAFGITLETTLNDMNTPEGSTIGNGLEVLEAWDYMTASASKRSPRLHRLILDVAAKALLQNKLANSVEEAEAKINLALSTGKAAERFAVMLCEQGVSPAFTSDPKSFIPKANIVRPVYPDTEGYVESMNMRWIGLSVIQMGGGHLYLEQKIDYGAGFSDLCEIGSYVSPEIPLAFAHANDEATAEQACVHLKGAIKVAGRPA